MAASMRLTSCHRDAFVKAVMHDVPMVDYGAQFTELVREAEARYLAKISPLLAQIQKDPKTTSFLERSVTSRYYPEGFYYVIAGVPVVRGFAGSPEEAAIRKKAQLLGQKAQEQYDERGKLEHKVKAAIAACTTVKVAKERLPEFAKYLPEDKPPVSRSLPAVADLVKDLSRAGWPKGKEPASAGA